MLRVEPAVPSVCVPDVILRPLKDVEATRYLYVYLKDIKRGYTITIVPLARNGGPNSWANAR